MSIEKLASGNYRVRINDKSLNRRVTVGTFPTKASARMAEQKAEIEWRLTGTLEVRKDRRLVDLLDEYLSSIKHLSKNTQGWYADSLKPALRFFGEDVSVRRLDKGDMQRFAADCVMRGYAPLTTRSYIKALSTLMNYAVDLGYRESNPALRLRNLPKKRRLEGSVRAIQPLEHERLVGAIPTEYRVGRGLVRFRGYQVMVALMPFVGLRRSEIQGLTWDCVDLDAGVLRVEKQLRPDGSLDPELKTAKSRRIVQLSEQSVRLLAEWRLESQPNPLNLVFPSIKGRPQNQAQFYRIWRKACAEAGLEGLDPHDLRHSFATWTLAAGCNPKWVADQMGHEKPSITLDTYAHLLPSADGEASQKVDSWYKRQRPAKISAHVVPTRDENRAVGRS